MIKAWDKIYKDYKKGGPAWASLSDGILPEFEKFIAESNFVKKSAFDIGFGTGKYLKFLSALGFKTAGIDNSETALEMAKESLGPDARLETADMFNFKIPANNYDLIISIATIHHGMKEQIKNLVDEIFGALIPDGKIFINFPNLDSRSEWRTFKTGKEIADGTIVPLEGPEMGVPHSIFSKEEIQKLFINFEKLSITEDKRKRWVVTGEK